MSRKAISKVIKAVEKEAAKWRAKKSTMTVKPALQGAMVEAWAKKKVAKRVRKGRVRPAGGAVRQPVQKKAVNKAALRRENWTRVHEPKVVPVPRAANPTRKASTVRWLRRSRPSKMKMSWNRASPLR